MEVDTAPAPATSQLEGARLDARHAVLELLASTGFDTGVPDHQANVGDDDEQVLTDINDFDSQPDEQTIQIQLCGKLLDALHKVQQEQEASIVAGSGKSKAANSSASNDDDENLAPAQQNIDNSNSNDFIRTNMMDYNNKTTSATNAPSPTKAGVRDALVNLPSSAMSNLPAVLSQLLTDRVDASSLLPATQDEQANLEALGLAGDPAKKSMTISRLGLIAGRVYAELIAMPGAWGAGLIDAAAVSALSALVRRWSLECRGREPGAGDEDDDDDNNNSKKKKGKKNARKRGGQGDAGGKSSKRGRKGDPRKRKGTKGRGGAGAGGGGGKKTKTSEPVRRSARSTVVAKLSDNETDYDDYEEEESDFEEDDHSDNEVDEVDMQASTNANANANGNNNHSEQEMVIGGLRLALSIAKVPILKEFINWSSEAKEAILDAVTVAMACSSALLASPSIAEGGSELRSLCNAAAKSLSHALQTCVVIRDDTTAAAIAAAASGGASSEAPLAKTPSRSANRGGNNRSTAAGAAAIAADAERAMETSQETAVFVLRGLLPLLSLHVELPMGQKGKLNAHDAAADVLEGIIGSLSDDIEKYDSIVKAASRPCSRRSSHDSSHW